MAKEVDGSGSLEVSLRDVNGDEYIYWVKLKKVPDGADEYDWAIEVAQKFHMKTVGTKPAKPEDENDLPLTACEPFTRNDDEFKWAN